MKEIHLNELIKSDNPGLSNNSDIKARLDYAFLIQNMKKKQHRNGFVFDLSWLFAFKNLGIKAGLITAIFASILYFGDIQQSSARFIHADSTQTSPILKDTLPMLNTNIDSCNVN